MLLKIYQISGHKKFSEQFMTWYDMWIILPKIILPEKQNKMCKFSALHLLLSVLPFFKTMHISETKMELHIVNFSSQVIT